MEQPWFNFVVESNYYYKERRDIRERGKIGSIGGLVLCDFLIVTGVSMLIGGTSIPVWFTGILALY